MTNKEYPCFFTKKISLDACPQALLEDILHHFLHQLQIVPELIYPKFYWKNQSGTHRFYALGGIHQLHPKEFKFLDPQTSKDGTQDLLFFYAPSFENEIFDPTSLGIYVPQFCLEKIEDNYFLHYQVDCPTSRHWQKHKDQFESIHQVLQDIPTSLKKISSNQSSLKISSTSKVLPSKSQWEENIKRVQDQFSENKTFKKLVLAQKREGSYSGDTRAFLKYYHGQKEQDTTSYFIYYSLNSKHLYISNSPERLFNLRDHRFQTEALAGTCSLDQEEALKKSSKDLNEHQLVIDGIIESLKSFDPNILIHLPLETKVLKLKYLAHLKTIIEATLSKDQSELSFANILEIIQILHPTAAISGYPQKLALQYLKELEPFVRGPYAAPIGWAKRSRVAPFLQSEFAVGIRSILLHQKKLSAWAGCGIVCESQAEKEWEEGQLKLKSIWPTDLRHQL